METITISTAALPFPAAPIAMSARLRTPALPIEMSWRRVPGNGGALFAAGYSDAHTAAVSATRVDHNAVAKQASPPRGSRLVG